MKVSPQANSIEDVVLTLVPMTEVQRLYQRKTQALKLVADCKQYISHKISTEELKEHIKALKEQDDTLSTTSIIGMLLDYAEREFQAIDRIEKGEVSLLARTKNFFQTFTNISE